MRSVLAALAVLACVTLGMWPTPSVADDSGGAALPDAAERGKSNDRETSGRGGESTGGAAYGPRPRDDRSGNRDVRHFFPVRGSYLLGDRSSRFKAPRGARRHQGQDISAAKGTPVVAPSAGTVVWRGYQARGAGFYLVIRAREESYDYVFMHLKEGSLRVGKGTNVRGGEELAAVGNSGRSFGPHLHFEIWCGPWFDGGRPIDPLPHLRAWAATSGPSCKYDPT
jgi:murein DD-endopeptidase MepM/ murein hydrolase activator NlpD